MFLIIDEDSNNQHNRLKNPILSMNHIHIIGEVIYKFYNVITIPLDTTEIMSLEIINQVKKLKITIVELIISTHGKVIDNKPFLGTLITNGEFYSFEKLCKYIGSMNLPIRIGVYCCFKEYTELLTYLPNNSFIIHSPRVKEENPYDKDLLISKNKLLYLFNLECKGQAITILTLFLTVYRYYTYDNANLQFPMLSIKDETGKIYQIKLKDKLNRIDILFILNKSKLQKDLLNKSKLIKKNTKDEK